MTKFKKCDYCKMCRKNIKKYKSGTIDTFGENLHSKTEMGGGAVDKYYRVIFWLCDMCIDFLVPKEYRHNNVISDKWLNDQPSEIWNIQKRESSLGSNEGVFKGGKWQ